MNLIDNARAWKHRNVAAAICSLAMIASFGAIAAEAGGAAETRVSESAYFADDGRSQRTPNRVSTDEHDAISKTGDRNEKLRSGQQQKLNSANSRTPNTDFWIYTADVELFRDDDRDGYYHGIDLYFDADTIFLQADVYAVVYLSLDGGPWTEYAETETFSIFGATSDDDYTIVTELLSGYPRGSYDILIELYDTFDNTFVADFGPETTSELAFLPLEDAERDLPNTAPTVIVNQGGGGAIDGPTLAVLVMLATVIAVVRRRRRRLVLSAVRAPRRGPFA